jgi:hypothetical protein
LGFVSLLQPLDLAGDKADLITSRAEDRAAPAFKLNVPGLSLIDNVAIPQNIVLDLAGLHTP